MLQSAVVVLGGFSAVGGSHMTKVFGVIGALLLALFLPGLALAETGGADVTAGDPSAYRLGPEDQIRISVWDNKELTVDLVVRPDGKISMPLLQDIPAEGRTVENLALAIRLGLEKFVRNPQVSVIVLQVNSPRFFVLGAVLKPGPYPLRSSTTVLQALSIAGGFGQFASPRKMKLVRNNAGKQETRTVNYYDLLEDDGGGNVPLKPGDTIVVP